MRRNTTGEASCGSERGQVLIVAALGMTIFLGLAGLAIDSGYYYTERRQTQNAADEAAVAAARVLFEGGSETSARSAALQYAAANGLDSNVTVHIPPESGEHVGDPTFAEVIAERQPRTFFIHLIVEDGGTVRGRGVAGYPLFPEPYALVVLNDHDCRSYEQTGEASLGITGGGIMVNSDCTLNALRKTGTGAITVDGTIDVNGGYTNSGSGEVSPSPRTVPWTVEDPLASVPAPNPEDYSVQGAGTAEDPQTWTYNSGADLTLSPGTYYGGFSANCVCTITLEPGVYVMAGGGFAKAGGANFVGDGVTIYVTEDPTNPTGDGAPEPFNLTGTGNLDLSPPTSGIYQGITLWQDRAITSDFSMTGSNDLVSGIFYAPGAQLDISGDSQFGTVQIIVDGFNLSGNAPLDLTYGEYRQLEAPKVVLVE